MTTTQTKSAVRRVLDEAFNQGNLAVIDEVFTPNHFTHTASPGIQNNNEGLKQLVTLFRTAFPDLNCTVEDEINADGKVAAHWTMSGTHKGPLMGTPPTGKSFSIQGLLFARIENGKIAEDWTLTDQMGMLQQLGLVPPPTGQ
jgi:steroid delta-isomerase-like uncharacterized protein